MNKKFKQMFINIVSIILLVCLDQYVKKVATLLLKDKEPYYVIKDVFHLHYLENRGAAFGMLQNQKLFFVFMAAIVLGVIIFVLQKSPIHKKFRYMRICLVLIGAGAIGNLIDRLTLGYVVDLFYFILIDFPIFNVADIYVSVGTFLFVVLLLFYYSEDDLRFLKIKIQNNNLRF